MNNQERGTKRIFKFNEISMPFSPTTSIPFENMDNEESFEILVTDSLFHKGETLDIKVGEATYLNVVVEKVRSLISLEDGDVVKILHSYDLSCSDVHSCLSWENITEEHLLKMASNEKGLV